MEYVRLSQVWILTLSCGDKIGIVANVAEFVASRGGNILDAQQFSDQKSGRFFMRVLFAINDEATRIARLHSDFETIAQSYNMEWHIRNAADRKNVLILVSKFDHCLTDLLYRSRIGELSMEVVGVISNHPLQPEWNAALGDIPFYHLPVTPETKVLQEARVKELFVSTKADIAVLARYMQILSNDMAQYLAGCCINIHHSFLPGFKGSKPYHQAYERGVKMIGATAHYITADLDEGPIIAQDAEPICHADTVEDLIRKGRDIERRVLADAVSYHLSDRVFLNGSKTVVFRH